MPTAREMQIERDRKLERIEAKLDKVLDFLFPDDTEEEDAG